MDQIYNREYHTKMKFETFTGLVEGPIVMESRRKPG